MLSLIELQTKLKEIVKGQDDTIDLVSTAFYKYILKLCARDLGYYFNSPQTIMVRGKTGVGKTFLVKTCAEILDLPFIEINAKTIVQDGWHGKSFLEQVETQVKDLQKETNRHIIGAVIFIDEFDKLIIGQSSTTKENVNWHIQCSLLKSVEGSDIKLNNGSFNLSNCMFVFAGAFEFLEEKICPIGFDNKKDILNKEQKIEKLIEAGLLPELAGRISEYCELNPITKEVYKELLDSQYFIFNKWKHLLLALGIDFHSIDSNNILIDQAVTLNLGVRGLIQLTESLITDTINQNKELIDANRFSPLHSKPTKGSY